MVLLSFGQLADLELAEGFAAVVSEWVGLEMALEGLVVQPTGAQDACCFAPELERVSLIKEYIS